MYNTDNFVAVTSTILKRILIDLYGKRMCIFWHYTLLKK